MSTAATTSKFHQRLEKQRQQNQEAGALQSPPKECYKVAGFLLNNKASGLKLREGVLNGRRLQYFRGKNAIAALVGKYAGADTEEAAADMLDELLEWQLLVKCDKAGHQHGNNKELRINPHQTFNAESYYAWLYEGNNLMTYLGGAALVAVVLAGVMFPLWPATLRQGTWYLSMLGIGFLIFLFVLAIVRLILFGITMYSHPPGLWLFPNLFEDVGFFESFVPLYAWHVDSATAAKNKKAAAAAGTVEGTAEGSGVAQGNEGAGESKKDN